MYLMILFMCIELKKNISFWIFFQFKSHFFCTGTHKKIGWWYTGSIFLGLQMSVIKTVYELQTNSMTGYWSHIFQNFKYRCLNCKQIRWRYTGSKFIGFQRRCFWENSTFMFFYWKWWWDQISIKLRLLFNANCNSRHNLFLLQTFQVYLTIFLLCEKES